MRLEFGHAVAVARGDEESLVERDPGVDLGRDGEELVLPGQVDLVEHQIFLLGPVRDAFEDALDAPRQLRGRVALDEDRLSLLEADQGGGEHRATAPAGWRDDARRGDQEEMSRPRNSRSPPPVTVSSGQR